MGKKQQIKKERRKNPVKHKSSASKSSVWLSGVIGVVVFLVIVIVVVITIVKMNQDKLIKFSLLSLAQQVEQELRQQQGKFTINDSKAMQTIINRIESIAADSNIDAVIGGNLNFMINVLKEIIKQGNLRPDELEKLQALLEDSKRRLEVNKIKKAK